MMDQTVVFFLAGILIVAAIILALICGSKKGVKRLDVERYRVRYLAIENQLKRDEESSHHLVVINADKLLDHALKDRGIKGQTMAERMKHVNELFSDSRGVWTAHKLRNKIVHEPDVKVGYEEARHALSNFKKALKDLGAI